MVTKYPLDDRVGLLTRVLLDLGSNFNFFMCQ